MITDDSIRSALEHLAGQTPDPRRVRGRLAARTRVVRRRRLLIASAGMAVLVGLAAAAVVLPGHRTGPAGAQVAAGGAVDAGSVLRSAALAAEHEQLLTARPDQYVFIESISRSSAQTFTCDGRAGAPSCAPAADPSDRTRRVWLSVDGTRDGLLSERPVHGGGWNDVPLTICRSTGVHAAPATGGANRQSPVCSNEPDPAYRGDLPTGAAAMLAYLDRQTPVRPAADGRREAWLFTTAADLIRERYVPPAALGALFGALAKVPGMTVTRGVVDAAGRSGIAVGYAQGAYRNELVFDPKTYAFLANRSVALRAVDGLRAGAVTFELARLRVAVVDKPGQLPG